ncbi:MAG: hypothetical protein U0326_27880 [Polyangiales bacterium]
MRFAPWISLACVCGCASVVTPYHVASDAPLPTADAAVDVPSPQPDDLDTFVAVGAAAVCEGLFRCCDASSRAAFRASYRLDPRTASAEADPPFEDEAGCRRYFEAKLGGGPFVDWIDAARRGLVRYDPAGSVACRRAIAAAACGEPMRNALANGACYGPFGSMTESRRMFVRSAGDGAPCRALRDEPVVGTYHGTCDPSSAYCCVPAPGGTGGCLSPYESVQSGLVVGQCRVAARLGAACTRAVGRDGAYVACVGNLTCANGASGCQPYQADVDLAVGDACFDPERGLSLGRCPAGSRCDGSGADASNTCIRTRAEGEPCERATQCASYRCLEGRCAPNDIVCAGSGRP